MKLSLRSLILAGGVLASGACSDDNDDNGPTVNLDGGLDGGGPNDGGLNIDAGSVDSSAPDAGAKLGFFVSSATSETGNLGGLAGADQRCQSLAASVGAGSRTWRAFLSVEHDATRAGVATEARERIGKGPWYNARGALIASDVAGLLALPSGNAELFLDEHGNKINGQWTGSPSPNEHDILTGTLLDGGVALGKTCGDWTSDAGAPSVAIVGHADGLGPDQNPNPPYNSWYSSHENAGCNDTAPRGGAGRIYCFAAD